MLLMRRISPGEDANVVEFDEELIERRVKVQEGWEGWDSEGGSARVCV